MQEDFKPKTNPIGKKYGRLLVVSFSHKKRKGYYYNCICDCGKEVIKNSHYLFSDDFPHKSCGCWHSELIKESCQRHKMSKTPTYKTWTEMKSRCYNEKSPEYKNYGARGIKVCYRWLNSFENFLEDMGERPDGTTIDRVDYNGDYEPSNCRWADTETQCNNRRNNIHIEYKGETKTLMQWCKIYNMNYNTTRAAYKRGKFSFDEIVNIYKNKGNSYTFKQNK